MILLNLVRVFYALLAFFIIDFAMIEFGVDGLGLYAVFGSAFLVAFILNDLSEAWLLEYFNRESDTKPTA